MCGDQGSDAASSNVTGFTFIPKNEHTYFAQHNKRVLLYQSFMEMQNRFGPELAGHACGLITHRRITCPDPLVGAALIGRSAGQ